MLPFIYYRLNFASSTTVSKNITPEAARTVGINEYIFINASEITAQKSDSDESMQSSVSFAFEARECDFSIGVFGTLDFLFSAIPILLYIK